MQTWLLILGITAFEQFYPRILLKTQSEIGYKARFCHTRKNEARTFSI